MADNLRSIGPDTANRNLEARLKDLDLSEQLNLVLTSPWENRFEIITSSRMAGQIVQNMPVEELFWTIKATGIQDSSLLLGMSSPEQLQFIFDLDWWHKDRLRADKIAAWLLVMFELSEEGLRKWLKWILDRDPWLFPALLHQFVQIVKRPDDMDIQEAKDLLPPFTVDNVYFIDFKKKKLAPLFIRLITAIVETDPGRYRDIMESMLWETPSHNLETAYRLRCGRIGDFGIPDYYDSLDIYIPLEKEQMHTIEPNDPLLRGLPVNYDMPAFVPTLYVSDFPRLYEAVNQLAGRPDMERIVRESTGVANKILMADLVDLDDPEQLRHALGKAFSLINLGIEHLCQVSGRPPHHVLATHYLEEIARLSAGLLLPVGAEARRLFDDKRFKAMPHHLKQAVEEAAKRPPMLLAEEAQGPVHVKCMKELRQLRMLVKEASAWHRILDFLDPTFEKWQEAIDWEHTNMLAPEELASDSALATSTANLLVEGRFTVEPLDQGRLERLYERIEDLGTTGLDDYLGEVLEPLVSSDGKGLNRQDLAEVIIPRIVHIFQEFVHSGTAVAKEPEYVKHILTRLG